MGWWIAVWVALAWADPGAVPSGGELRRALSISDLESAERMQDEYARLAAADRPMLSMAWLADTFWKQLQEERAAASMAGLEDRLVTADGLVVDDVGEAARRVRALRVAMAVAQVSNTTQARRGLRAWACVLPKDRPGVVTAVQADPSFGICLGAQE